MAATAEILHPPMEDMSEAQLLAAMQDPMWRISNLYFIKTKAPKKGPATDDDDDDESADTVVKFKPNRAQMRLLKRLHYKNLILKARQMGFSTLIQILFLDLGMFTPNLTIGVIAHTDDAAKKLFKKIKFAYDRLPEVLRMANPQVACSAREMTLTNGSVISVGTSMRGDTIHYLHISEYGKICAKFPDRAEEVVTGTLPSVPDSGMIFIESTAEGREGDFYDKSQRAEALALSNTKLTNMQYRYHFYAWHEDAGYTMDQVGVDKNGYATYGVVISDKDREYFDKVEAQIGRRLTGGQRAWWVATRDEKFSGSDERMYQEYPSTSKEAFQASVEGTYYAVQFAALRKSGRITTVPYQPGIPVNTFWDIGNTDGCAIWLHQRVGLRDHFIKFIEGWGEPYAYYVRKLQATGYVWGRHHLPHDGAHVRQGQEVNESPQQQLENLGLRNIEIVHRVAELQHGIQVTRDSFATAWFDEEGCKEGLAHLEAYRKRWNSTTKTWSSEPMKQDGHSEAADAFRQKAQGYNPAADGAGWKRKPATRGNWRTR